MAAPSKSTSRWGSLLQQAVAGVESRLDNILADGVSEGGVGEEGLQAKKPPVATTPPAAAMPESSTLFAASNSIQLLMSWHYRSLSNIFYEQSKRPVARTSRSGNSGKEQGAKVREGRLFSSVFRCTI